MQLLLGVFVFLITLCCSSSVAAYDSSPQCYIDLGETFFTTRNVGEALSLFQTTQNQQTWSFITGDLTNAARGLHQRIVNQASKMNPNPLDYPFNKKVAKELLLQELFAIYRSVVVRYNISDEYTIKQTFQYIQNSNGSRIRACLGN